jgi:hypothetical protein
MTSTATSASIQYINPHAPGVKPPVYEGNYYETLVPATLDLAERASLAVNALTESLDPEYDYELYWIVDLLAPQPAMYHTVDDHVQDKFFQALPLVRTMCGSKQNLDVEHSLMQTYLRKQGPDGLVYIPVRGRPWALPKEPNPWAGLDEVPQGDHWCSFIMLGRVLGAFCIYALKDPSGPWREAANRLVEGIKRITIVEGDIAYPFQRFTEPGRPVVKPAEKPAGFSAAIAGWLAQGLAQCYRTLGNEDARDLAQKMIRYIMRDSGYFLEDGEFRREFPGTDNHVIHFHAHTCQIMAALEVVQATGDQELLKRAQTAYNYAISQGEPTLGFFPEWLNYKGGSYGQGPCSSEICEVADMIVAAVKLSLLGIDKWDDVDRWVRNQFTEGQLTHTHWLTDGHLETVIKERSPWSGSQPNGELYGTTERVAERVIGSFSGWPAANDFVQGQGWSIMHCCTGNGTRALYYVWESMLAYDQGKLRVNLLLNRASSWADIQSHIPYQGRVDILPKQDLSLEIRLPEWAQPEESVCTVNGQPRPLRYAGRYAEVGAVRQGDAVVMTFPIREQTQRLVVEKQPYTIIRRGNDVVAIDPPGKNWPLYQRGHYRTGETLWKKTNRFVPNQEIKWT